MDRKMFLTCGQVFGTMDQAREYISSRYTTTGICDGLGNVREANWALGLRRIEAGDYSPVPSDSKLPSSFSLQDKMPPVYNQASRGTCAANTAVALMEYYTGCRYRFSVQYLYERMKRAERESYQNAAVEMIRGKAISDPEMAEWAKNYIQKYIRKQVRDRGHTPTQEEIATALYNVPIEMDGGSTAKYVFAVLEKWGVCIYDIWPYAREQLDELDVVSDCNNQVLPPGADEDAKRHRLNDPFYIFPSPNNVEEIKRYLTGGSRYDPMPVYVGVKTWRGEDGYLLPEENGIARLPKIVEIDISTIECEVSAVNVSLGQYRVMSQDPDTVEVVGSVPVTDLHLCDGGHAMLLVGYVDDDAVVGGGYFIVRNSWGEEWGESGYGKLPYAYIELFATSAATILRPKDEAEPPSSPSDDIPDDLKPFVHVAASDAKDRTGTWRITKGDRVLVDSDGAMDRYTDSNVALFRRCGYSWKMTNVASAVSGAGSKGTVGTDVGLFSNIEIAFQGASIPFPLLGGVKKGIFSSPQKTERFTFAEDGSVRLGASFRIYDISGGKIHFRIAAVTLSSPDSAETFAEKARQLVREYNGMKRFDPCDCTIMVFACPVGNIAEVVPPYLTDSEVRIVLDDYAPETGWRVNTVSKVDDPFWHEWLFRLVPNREAQWRTRFERAYQTIDAQGGHVTVAKMAEVIGLPENEATEGVRAYLAGFKIKDGKVVKG